MVQAAAVWFDVDARIFEREIAGEFVLHTALPGAQVEDSARRLNSHRLASPPSRCGSDRFRNGVTLPAAPRLCSFRCRATEPETGSLH